MVKIIKLSSGEEIVGEEVSNTHSIILKNPMVIVYKYFPLSTLPNVKLVKYMMFSKENIFKFNHVDVINITEARDSFSEFYSHIIETSKESTDNNIDVDLRLAIELDKKDKDKFYESILEQMPTPKNAN